MYLHSNPVICDTREKKNAHVLDYFTKNNIPFVTKKLDVADYHVEGQKIVIDRKQNLGELSKNLMNAKDKSRFLKEVRRAKESGLKLIILCEHGPKIKSIEDIVSWSDSHSGVKGRTLMDAVYKIHVSYGVDFIFCSKRSTGARIAELLKVGRYSSV